MNADKLPNLRKPERRVLESLREGPRIYVRGEAAQVNRLLKRGLIDRDIYTISLTRQRDARSR